MTTAARAWILPANQPPARFYAGGERIAAFRGTGPAQPHTPEDWVGSVTTLFGHDRLGLSTLADSTLLADAVRAHPVSWLGADHVARYGDDPAVLVKLLDAGQRLPVHVHPDVPFAQRHLGLGHGKTEAWIFLEPAPVWLGFVRDVSREEVRSWVRDQDVDAMLGAMHRLQPAAGDAVLVPAGTPHAIGRGALVVELQEPTDLSVLMEWKDFAIDGVRDGHLGLGFDVALEALDRRGRELIEVASWRESSAEDDGALLPGAAEFFRAERLRGDSRCDAGFSVLVVADGEGVLVPAHGPEIPVRRGVTLLTPHAAGDLSLEDRGGLEVLRCRPPAA
ncbi:class I mannose-6-phosphate isomerase [Demequina muriae]|uniref:Class I mannose-6-phosphate isomerase n=1 Tax=Demequina muriae TaxID=3051664 RepID=A0ABT8GFN1_9MICO|nr:class I mannose-6-phosphate isomerase [Demequina sp. EGI L300058]MDN4479746.1 class I mannose-6-phosphate isomerase [Demequina sp. EGI L300058]